MEFRLLGPVEATDDEGRRLELGARQQRFVLAVLLLEANHVVPVTRLVELMWPDAPPRSARQSIQVRISQLRRLLGGSAPVHGAGGGYRIVVDPQAVDVHRFRSLVGAARDAAHEGADDQAVRMFRDGLALWSGEPLAGTAPDQVRQQLCFGLEEARLVAVEDCLDAELRRGRHGAVLDELTDLVRTHPTRERLVGQLMLGLHRCGQTARALEVLRDTRRLLVDELGIDPGAQLRDLELAILQDDPSLAPSQHPKAPPTWSAPAQLPPAAPGFTGRRAQIGELDHYVSTGSHDPTTSRVVVVSGMGGIGKTALALRWAHQVSPRFPDGQLYLDLRGHAAAPAVPPIEALAHFLRGLGHEPRMVPTDLDGATAAYRTALAGRSVLVVLDNAADAAQVRPLLPGAPGCVTVVTSRDRLAGLVARDGAHRLALDTLTADEAIEFLEKLLGPARAAAEADAVAALADLCARLPLALRIAAGFLTDNPQHPIEAYVEQLRAGNRLDALTIDGDDDAAIHAAFDLSYQRLAAPERRMFRLLGLVPGPDVTAGAAAALAAVSPTDASRLLARLRSTHLVTEHLPGRYALHDLLREYARRRVDTDEPVDERATATERLMGWYYLHSRAADIQLSPTLIRLPVAEVPDGVADVVLPADAESALAWFRNEGGNLRSAVSHAADRGPHRWAWLIGELERHQLPAVGDLVHYLTVTSAAVKAAEHCGDAVALSSAYLGYADALGRRDPMRARAVLSAALEPAEHSADPLWLASVLNDLAGIHVRLGEYEAAHDVLRRAMEQKQRVGPAETDPSTLVNLGILAGIRGNLREATDYLQRAVDAYGELGATRKEALALVTLAEMTEALGGAAEALLLLDRVTAAPRESGSHRSVEARIVRTVICTELGRFDAAEAEVANLVTAAERTDDPELVARAYSARGTLRHRLGDDEDAHRDHARAVQVANGSQDQHLSMRMVIGLAQFETATGRDDEAFAHADAVLTMARGGGARLVEGDALTILATLDHRRGDVRVGIARAEAALAVHRRTGHHLGRARALRALGLALLDGHDTEARPLARTHLREAYELFATFGSCDTQTVADFVQGATRR